MRPTVLVVDDDEIFRERLVRAFEGRGYEAWPASEGQQALERAVRESPEFAVVDLKMPGMGGLELVQSLRRIDEATRIVVLTGYGSIATAVEAVKLGATHYLSKPSNLDDIIAAFERSEGRAEIGELSEADVPSLARVEWEHIHRVLQDCGGNISKAARLLGLHRRSLQRKLQRDPVSL